MYIIFCVILLYGALFVCIIMKLVQPTLSTRGSEVSIPAHTDKRFDIDINAGSTVVTG